MDYAAYLRSMSRVLVMLASTCDKADRRAALRQVACAILKEYRDVVPSGQSDDVAGVVDDALSILEHLIVRCSRPTFTGAPSDEDIAALRELLSDLLDDPVFCTSFKKILGQPKCPLGTAGQVCSLLRCLLHAELLCFDAAGNQQIQSNRVAEKLFTAQGLGLPDLISLLQREIQALPASDIEKAVPAVVAALQRMCSIADILKSLLSLLRPSAGDDGDLTRSLAALEQWVRNDKVDLAAVAEAQRLLWSLLWVLEVDAFCWPSTFAAQGTLLCAMTPLGLGPYLFQRLRQAKVSLS